MGDKVGSAAFAGPVRPINVPLVKEPLTIYDEEEVTFFPQLDSNEALRDAVHSSGYGSVTLTREKIQAHKREVIERVRKEEEKKLTFRPNLLLDGEGEVSKQRKQIMKNVNSSGYAKSKGSDPAWLRSATDRIKKKQNAARPKPKVGPDGEPMFRPKITKTKQAKTIRSEVPSSNYGSRLAQPKKKFEKPPRPDFKPKVHLSKYARQLKKQAPSSKYGIKAAGYRVGYEERGGRVVEVRDATPRRIETVTPAKRMTARRRLSSSTLDKHPDGPRALRPSTPPEVKEREKGFVLDCVRVSNVDPLRTKYVEASEDIIGSIYDVPDPVKLDAAALALRESFISAPSSGYGTARYEPLVGRIEESGDAALVWSKEAKAWVMAPRNKDDYKWDAEAREWVRKERPKSTDDDDGSRPKFNLHGIVHKPKREQVDAWLVENPKRAVSVTDVKTLEDEDEDETNERVGMGNLCALAKPLPKVPKGYYSHVAKIQDAHSSEYGKKVPGWEFDPQEGGRVAFRTERTADGAVRKVRIEKKAPPSETDPLIVALHGGAGMVVGLPGGGKNPIPPEPAEKEIAWRAGIERDRLNNEVGSHGYGVVFPEVKARPPSPPHHVWVPPSAKPVIPEPESFGTTTLSRQAVGHYGPGYDPALDPLYDDVDAMYDPSASEEEEEEEEEEEAEEEEESEEESEAEAEEAAGEEGEEEEEEDESSEGEEA